MNEKYQNTFRFSLYQENVLLCEKMFDADSFNPFTRYSIDIRSILPRAITKFQKILSMKSRDYDVSTSVGDGKSYDLLRYINWMISLYPKEWKEDLKYCPKPTKQEFDGRVIKGVECKIGLYINENTIVERIFYVDGFNPVARYSLDVIDVLLSVVDNIFSIIKKNDIKNIWDDYDLINKRGLNFTQIRELTPGKRAFLLKGL